MSPRAKSLIASACLLLAAGCSNGASVDDTVGVVDDKAATTPSAAPTPTPTPTPASTPSRAASEASVPEILDFRATTVAGEDFSGAAVAGKPVVLWFWAPWCPQCRGQGPRVTGLAEQYDGRVSFVGIGSLDSGDAIAGFAEDWPAVTQLTDPEGDLWKRFGIVEQSSFVVLDADGEEVLRTGYADDGEVADAVASVA